MNETIKSLLLTDTEVAESAATAIYVDLQDRDLIELGSRGYTFLDHSEAFRKEWSKFRSVSNSKLIDLKDLMEREPGDIDFVWHYFPWKKTFVKLPSENFYFTLRTVRNLYKLTRQELLDLSRKKVGIIGLSVGQAVAIPLVLERICGELRIADFDSLELTNMNRLQTSVIEIGLNKAVITARRIAELDPYFKVKTFETGINADNINEFVLGGGKLDLVIDECDSGDIKLLTRRVCRKHGIPVIMETSDRGLLDVERYDLEPNLPLLHGMFDEVDEHLNLSDEAKRNLLLKAIDFTKVSDRGIQSMTEIGKSITSWPQLATDVVSGGATAAMAARLILLGHGLKSGRVYVDIQSRIFEALGASAFNSEGKS